ncbi:MAG: Integrase catalytic region [Chthonomonadaceae bacterium]|nr:Integrase catalytic region [Chthonomonadaceae bacterium]
MLKTLLEDRFVDRAPRQIVATLLDENIYLCSASTMYRILHTEQMLKERRAQARHPAYKKPELLATGPNQIWSWDITKLKGPVKYSYYCLYVILDIFSRFVVGWMVAERECAELARELILSACLTHQVGREQLTVHADRGSAMTSKSVTQLLVDLGVTKTHSRPHVSDDNPYSESQFKTIKYAPRFPARFGSLQDAQALSRELLDWYNNEHRHSGIAMLTPAMVHNGESASRLAARQVVLSAAYGAHPERFVSGPPQAGTLPEAVWINPPLAIETSRDDTGANHAPTTTV